MEPPLRLSNVDELQVGQVFPILGIGLGLTGFAFVVAPNLAPAAWPAGLPPLLLSPRVLLRVLLVAGYLLAAAVLLRFRGRDMGSWRLYPGLALFASPLRRRERPLRKSELWVIEDRPKLQRLADTRQRAFLAHLSALPVPFRGPAERARFEAWLAEDAEAVELEPARWLPSLRLGALALLGAAPALIATARFTSTSNSWEPDPSLALVRALAWAGALGALALILALARGLPRRVLATRELLALGDVVVERARVHSFELGDGLLRVRYPDLRGAEVGVRVPCRLSAARARELLGEGSAGERFEVRERRPWWLRRLLLALGTLLLGGALAMSLRDLPFHTKVTRLDPLGQRAWLVLRVSDGAPRAMIVVSQPLRRGGWGFQDAQQAKLALTQPSALDLLLGRDPPAKLWLPEREAALEISTSGDELVLTDTHQSLVRRRGPLPAGLKRFVERSSWDAPLPLLLDTLFPAVQGDGLTPFLEGRKSCRTFQVSDSTHRLTWGAVHGQVSGLIVRPSELELPVEVERAPGEQPGLTLRLLRQRVGPGEAVLVRPELPPRRLAVELDFEALLAATRRIERGAAVSDELDLLVPQLLR